MNKKLEIFIIGSETIFRKIMVNYFMGLGYKVVVINYEIEEIESINLNFSKNTRVIFTPVESDEVFALTKDIVNADTTNLINVIEDHSKKFLNFIQLILKNMLFDGGQIWITDWDDSIEYHFSMPVSPILSELRAATVRTLAKEYSRMGIKCNSILMQVPKEYFSEKDIRKLSKEMKSYAMRYKPTKIEDILNTINDLINQENLPMSGAMLGFGQGVNQGALIQ